MVRIENIQKPIYLNHSSLKYPLPKEFLEELSKELKNMNQYPSGSPYNELSDALAQYTGVFPQQILPTNGSDEAIEAVTRSFGNQFILIPTPTFSQYELSADRNDFSRKLVPCLNHHGDYQLNYTEKDLKEASLVWICNPNNPTGNSIPREKIEETLIHASGIVAVDECNYEYLGDTMVDLIHQYPNLVVIRSFSKNFGLAGFRLGFAVSSAQNIEKISRFCQCFNVNKMAEIAGIKVLKYLNYYKRVWQAIEKIRNNFIQGLLQLEVKAFPSKANFILVDFITEENTKRVWNDLKKNNVHTFAAWDGEFSGLENHYIRFTVGNKEEMDYVLKLLRIDKENH
ncbi:MAG: aminotransferase class I/II-fold pyridoxal phosphate-dependent enzyme [Candidatus Atribacteria bacterium]|nr:aminotransferase class I/II-fold pyridoxal phosphate-dependent enzyme [Candidatus Atribacteria bacterium]